MKACIIQPPYSRDVSLSDEYFEYKLERLNECDESGYRRGNGNLCGRYCTIAIGVGSNYDTCGQSSCGKLERCGVYRGIGKLKSVIRAGSHGNGVAGHGGGNGNCAACGISSAGCGDDYSTR